MANITTQNSNIAKMKSLVNSDSVKARLENLIGKSSGTFMASVLDLYSSDNYLQKCTPESVMAECMKAAALQLPISKSLGLAYVIPYGSTPTFILSYRGLIQLAQRSGAYRFLNADCVFEGQTVKVEPLSGMVEITGEPVSDKVVGYYAYFKLTNGFEKCIYWTKERVENHAKRYSKAFNRADSPWKSQFDAMALKTVLKQLISKYGPMSIEISRALENDADDRVDNEVAENANKTEVTIPTDFVEEPSDTPLPFDEPPADEIPDDPGF